MRLSTRIGIVLVVIILSAVSDWLYNNVIDAASFTLNFNAIFTITPIIFVVYYLLISFVMLELILRHERNIIFTILLIIFGLFAIWMSNFQNPGFLIPFRTSVSRIIEILKSPLGLTIHSATFFMAVGLLRLLPVNFFSRFKQ